MMRETRGDCKRSRLWSCSLCQGGAEAGQIDRRTVVRRDGEVRPVAREVHTSGRDE